MPWHGKACSSYMAHTRQAYSAGRQEARQACVQHAGRQHKVQAAGETEEQQERGVQAREAGDSEWRKVMAAKKKYRQHMRGAGIVQ